MTDRELENLNVYEKAEHWPPFTFRNYPDATSESLSSFVSFLGTENTSHEKKELQPWIPFCDSRCTFCYFPVETHCADRAERYVLALKRALGMYAGTTYVKSSEFDEIYFGGGTPNVLSSEQLICLLSFCEKEFNVSKKRTIKLSGCTHNFDERKLRAMADYGVDQLDLGIQTFDDGIRGLLNLQDTSDQAEKIIRTAHRLGLRVSIDLMYNLPGQTMSIWKNDIQKALELDVESADCYPLDVHPETALAKQLRLGKVPPVKNSNTETEMYLEACNAFSESGYKPTCHNRFSRITDDFGEPCFELLGTGAGFFMGHLGRYAYTDVESTSAYIDAVSSGRFPIAKISVSSEDDEMKKMMMRLYIRLAVDKHEFRTRFRKLPEEVFPKAIKKLKDKGLIEIDDREIKLTKMGDAWRFNIAWEFGQREKHSDEE